MQTNWSDIFPYSDARYVALTVILLIIIYYCLSNNDVPPGPMGLPYFGLWPFLRVESCHLQMLEFKKKYGEVFSFWTTSRLYVVLGSFKANREAFLQKSDCFSRRIQGYSMVRRVFRGSVLMLDGEKWKVNRKFFSQQFRERGMSNMKGEMGGPIYDGIKETVQDLKKLDGKATDIIEMLMPKCTAILFKTCFGEDGITEQEIRDLNVAYAGFVEHLNGPLMFPIGTFAKYFIFPFSSSFRAMVKNITVMEKLLQKIIDRHKATYDENNIRNLIDAYQKEKIDKLARKDSTAYLFSDTVLIGSLIQFIGDGVVAVAAFIGAYLQAVLEHPEDQEKMYRELMEVVGASRDPTLEDKSKMPYTSAFISEMLRTSPAFPFFPKMECTKDVTICGRRVPKGAAIVVNIWSSHMDPEVYDEPEKFNPSRFLPVEGQKKPEQPMLFGMGKTSCLGEGFTMLQVFLFMTTILKHFRLAAPRDKKDNDFLFFQGKIIICAHPRKD